ncbi:MAG TPA: ornithine cyclodeaminase family protein [Vicinamibacterales bacterium]|jgi:ornithine cyclodeaminase|nr:ornithine cyclodeaminase family protein [Vicinamibacterales bacterium]
MPVLLTEREVRRLLPMPDLIRTMEQGLGAFSGGTVTQPVRQVLEVGPDRAFFGVMPAAVDAPDPIVGTKLVTVFHRNEARGLPSHLATIVLLDPETGALEAILDGRYITEARTAAVSAVSVKLLARPDASVLAILGSGVQARSHLEAIRHVRPLREVRVWSPRAAQREAFATEMSAAAGIEVRAVSSAAEAARGAPLVALTTAATAPILDTVDVDPGAHIAAVGACRPTHREMTTALVARAHVYVDSRAGALSEAGDLMIPIGEGAILPTHIVGEIGELVLGRIPGRQHDDDVTLFKSLGMAVEDVLAARLACTRARDQQIGQVWSPQ